MVACVYSEGSGYNDREECRAGRTPHPTQAAERQASAGARDGVKGQGRTLAARAPLHALVRLPTLGAFATSGRQLS